MFDDREMRRPTQGVPVQHSCESIAKIASNKSSDLHIQGDPWDGSALKSQQISFLHTLSPRHQNTQDVTDSSVGCVPLSVFIQNRPRVQRVDTCTWQCGSVTAVHYSTQKYKSPKTCEMLRMKHPIFRLCWFTWQRDNHVFFKWDTLIPKTNNIHESLLWLKILSSIHRILLIKYILYK